MSIFKRSRKKTDALQAVQILIADADPYMARVLKQNLLAMGFGHVLLVGDGSEAMLALKMRPFDIFITEWPLPLINGIELVRQLRRGDHPAGRAMPIIMLTGKGERADVQMARDSGITEFVVKPFSSQALYTRLEQLIEYPRGFLLSPNFVGPDRRRKSVNAASDERRVAPPVFVETATLEEDYYTPRIIAPDYSLKHKTILNEPLRNIITPAVLEKAQAAIESMRDESHNWIKEDLVQLEAAYKALTKGYVDALHDLKEAALSIKSRAGTFGYHLTSEVARLLYRFASTAYNGAAEQHNMILLKHIESMKVIFASQITGKEISGGNELAQGLELLVAKYREAR